MCISLMFFSDLNDLQGSYGYTFQQVEYHMNLPSATLSPPVHYWAYSFHP